MYITREFEKVVLTSTLQKMQDFIQKGQGSVMFMYAARWLEKKGH